MTRLASDTAMVLAAGLGTRMRPLTNDRPKPLVEVAGKPLVDHALDRLAEAGVARAVVNVHHFGDAVEAHVAARTAPAVTISDERAVLLETGGGMVRAAPLLPDPFFCVNSDNVWLDGPTDAFHQLSAAWDPARMDVCLLLAKLDHSIGFEGAGDFFLADDGRLTFRGEAESAPYAYMGLHITKPQIVDAEGDGAFSLAPLWRQLAEQGRLYGAVMDGFWMHVGDPVARDAAEARLR